MASGSDFNRNSGHCRFLRRQRSSLVKELPEPALLLENLELSKKFTPAEKEKTLKGDCQSRRAEKFLDCLELKPSEVFELFMQVMRNVDPILAEKLKGRFSEIEGAGGSKYVRVAEMNGIGDHHESMSAMQESGRQQPYGNMEEDAGVFGLNGPGPGQNIYHMSCLGYNCREFLGGKLNGKKPDRNTFRSFCRAMAVEERLERASLNSGNPTAYLIQKLSEDQNGTMARLEKALEEMGLRDVYDEVLILI